MLLLLNYESDVSLQYGMLWLTYVVVVVELEVRSDVEVRYVALVNNIMKIY